MDSSTSATPPDSVVRRKTCTPRMDRALELLTPERLLVISEPGPMYSKATLAKHPWAVALYESFVRKASIDTGNSIEPWPLTAEALVPCIRFLGIDAEYALTSLQDVVVPSLLRVHYLKTGTQLSDQDRTKISNALRDVRRQAPSQEVGTAPAIFSDVEHIIGSIPDGLVTKAEEAALFLLALSTGARAITCANVLVGDIVNVIADGGKKIKKNSGCRLVQIRFRVTKGNPKWNHIVALRGDITRRYDLNVVYWLEQHLHSKVGLSV